MRSKEFILETTGTGAAFLDYDGDGDQDLFLANGSRVGYDASQSLSNALFRNDGAGRFVEGHRTCRTGVLRLGPGCRGHGP